MSSLEKAALRRLRRLRANDHNGRNYRRLMDWVTAKVFAGHKEVTRLAREAGAVIINLNPPENN
jgi:hypothetical protein